jgi:CubicO group peptidase (beta-lactamase class C family)
MQRSPRMNVIGNVVRAACLAAVLAPAAQAGAGGAPWPDPYWQVASPESEGLDSAKLADAVRAICERQIPVHAILIVRNGRQVLDATFFPFRREEAHDIASCTKSVTSTLIGAAIDRGDLSGVDQPVLPVFGGHAPANPDGRKDRIRLEDLLSMRSGLDCHSDHSEITLRQMMASPHWVPFMLDLPMAADPGSTWVYCSGGMHVLSGVISRVEGRSAFEFAGQVLFGPLGIRTAAWRSDPDGVSTGWGDLELQPRDMAKLGYLWLHGGEWDGRRIVGSEYMRQATLPLTVVDGSSEYGFGFWVSSRRQPPSYAARGRGGQQISVIPGKALVAAVAGGGYNQGELDALLGPALHDGVLPPNPAGEARLQSALAEAVLPQAPSAAPAPPQLAGRLSGRTFRLTPAPFGISALTFRFDRPGQAEVTVEETNGRRTSHPIGLDGVPRLSPNPDAPGHAEALRGEWTAPGTFHLDIDLVAKINRYDLTLTFQGDALAGEAAERTGLGSAEFTGSADPAGK